MRSTSWFSVAVSWQRGGAQARLLAAGWLSHLLMTYALSVSAAPNDPVVWRFALSGGGYSSPALSSDGTIYVTTAWPGHCLYALAPDGTLKWSFVVSNGVWASPAVGRDGTVYFTCGNGKLYAVTPAGQERWSFQTGRDCISSPAVAIDGTVYFGSRDGRIYAVNPDGQQKWAYVTAGYVDGGPSLGPDGTVYCGSGDHKLHALDPDGHRRWTFYAGAPIFCYPTVSADGAVYFGTLGGRFFAFNQDGTERWHQDLGGDLYSSAAIGADGTIYVGVGRPASSLVALRPDGSRKWSFATLTNDALQGVYSSPAISDNGTIWFGAYDRRVYALSPAGEPKLVFETGSWVFGSPAIAPGGVVYIASNDQTVYALRCPDGGSALADAPWPKFHGDAANSGSRQALSARITLQPEGQTVLEGQDVTLVGAATGSATMRYQWQFNGVDIDGATDATLQLSHVSLAQSGQYRLVALDLGGPTYSGPALLTVKPLPDLDFLWTVRNPLGAVQDLKAVAYGGGVFIAVGAGGAIVASPDADTWSPVNSPVSSTLNAVAYGAGRFVAVGESGTLLQSADGGAWQVAPSPTTNGFFQVAFGNDRFVATSRRNEVAVSTNGVDWTIHWLGTTLAVKSLAFGDGVFVGVASQYLNHWRSVSYVFASADGQTWIQQCFESSNTEANQVVYGDGRFLITSFGGASGVWLISDDGTNWRAASSGQGGGFAMALAYGGGCLLAAPSAGYAPISTNRGESWVTIPAAQSLQTSAITYGRDRFVAVGRVGAIAATASAPGGGIQWQERSLGARSNLRAVAWGNGRYVAVGEQQLIMTSTDGIHWSWNGPAAGQSGTYTAVAFGAGQFVALAVGTPTLTSVNGLDWQLLWSGSAASWRSVTYTGGRFVAVGGDNSILAWPNGGGHAHYYGQMETYVGAAYGNGLYVGVGERGGALVSTNAVEWTEVRGTWRDVTGTRFQPNVRALAYGNGRFLAVTGSGLAMSKDGCNWQVLPTSFQANCLQFADGYFYAFGSQDARSGLAVSTEGLYWDFREAPGASAFAVGPGQIIVVGELGLVREGASSRPRLAWRNVTGVDDLALEINGTRVGGQYELQASPDLRAWATRLPLAGSVETIAVTNLLDLAASARFFRVLKLP